MVVGPLERVGLERGPNEAVVRTEAGRVPQKCTIAIGLMRSRLRNLVHHLFLWWHIPS